MTRAHTRQHGVRSLALLVVIVAALTAFVPSSSARPAAPADHDSSNECDGPGEDTNHGACPAQSPTLTIVLSITQGEAKVRVGVKACGYEAGVVADLVFGASQSSDGTVVLDNAVTGADGCVAGTGPTSVAAGEFQLISAVQSINGHPAAISVPASSSLGAKFVCANAVGYALNCTGFTVIASKSSGGTGGGGGRDSLALTGLAVGILLAVALALIVVGRAMLSASRARRRSRIVTGVALHERTSTSV